MKRFWLVMLSLGLVLAFSASAMAVDVKFSGSFYAAGMYLDKTTLMNRTNGSDKVSTAFYFQRLRVGTDFIVSPGLKLVTRFDAMERAWGAPRSSATDTDATDPYYSGKIAQASGSAATVAENENIAFDIAYVQWVSPIGAFMAGYQVDGEWGTQFGDNDSVIGKLVFATQVGNLGFTAQVGKDKERSYTAKNTSQYGTDRDSDKYVLAGQYQFNKDIKAGLLYAFYSIKQYKGVWAPLAGYGFESGTLAAKAHAITPYVTAKIGPVSVEAEALYLFGNANYEDGLNIGKDISLGQMTAYVGAMVDLGPAYFGGKFAYMSGDDNATSDKWEGGQIGGGSLWNPTLILFNNDRTVWAGSIPGHAGSSPTYLNRSPDSDSGLFGQRGMNNAWFGQGVIGGRPIPALDIRASLAYAAADKKPTGYLNSAYGWELDVTGTYKITNNLSYMLGVGYLFTGDYYKYNSNTNDIQNDYLLINKLTLTF